MDAITSQAEAAASKVFDELVVLVDSLLAVDLDKRRRERWTDEISDKERAYERLSGMLDCSQQSDEATLDSAKPLEQVPDGRQIALLALVDPKIGQLAKARLRALLKLLLVVRLLLRQPMLKLLLQLLLTMSQVLFMLSLLVFQLF